MDLLNDVLDWSATFVPMLATITVVVGLLFLINRALHRRWRDQPEAQFRFQLIMLALTLAGIVAIILAIPMSEATHGQLLSLLGILLSATIALSSTTFMGNIMAGVMLKVIRSARPGDFITVADLTGRITEMDLLHTEIQTEFRDLVTVPNLYMVTQPVKVVRASGTIISTEVSIGYDVPHSRISSALCSAAESAGLSDVFAQVRELGDFAVTYRVAGLLEDVKSLISARSALRKATLDALHGDGIEIVSPSFMNQRRIDSRGPVISRVGDNTEESGATRVEDVMFDKAEGAASVEQFRKSLEKAENELKDFMTDKGKELSEAETRLQKFLESRRDRIKVQLESAEKRQRAADLDE